MDNWTVEMVEDRLAEAAAVIRRLPPVRVPSYFNTWPPMVVEFADRVGQDPEPTRLPPPPPAAVSRMEETLSWLRWLKAEHAKLGTRGGQAVEADLLAIRHRASHSPPALAVRAEFDRVPAQRKKANCGGPHCKRRTRCAGLTYSCSDFQ